MRFLSRVVSFFKEKWLIFLLSLLISIPISYFFLAEVNYLSFEIEREEITRPDNIYFEFEGEIRSVSFLKWESSLQVMGFDKDRTVFNQWNIGGRMSDLFESSVLIEDIDGDNLPDVSFLQIIGNKIYLAIVPVSLRDNYYHRYFLDSIQFSEMDPRPIYLHDIKTYKNPITKKKNIAVIIYMGHAKYPRKLYVVDFAEDKVNSSKTDGNSISTLNIEDIDGDSLVEFFGNSFSPGNFQDISNLEYNDSSTYLMVFDENLEFEFPPVEFKSVFSVHKNFSFQTDSGNYYFTTINDNSSPRSLFPAYLVDLKGKIIDSVFIGSNKEPTFYWKESSGIYAFTGENDIYTITDFKNPEYLANIKDFVAKKIKYTEIEKNNGFFFITNEKETRVYNSRFRLLGNFESSVEEIKKLRISSFGDSSLENGKLLLQNANHLILLQYWKNPLWRVRLVLVFSFLVISFYLMNILAFLLSYQQSKRLEREKEITELRFNAIKNQLEPHFLFNSLNSIGHLLLTEERMKAYSYLESLSFLLRNAINNSSEIAVPLVDELLFTRKYLDIEKLRFEEKFDFEINVSESVDNDFPVPKMIIQLHSENAVKHGLLHKGNGGKIEISLNGDKDKLIIEIDDNGAGRAAQTVTKKNLGKGLIISEQMLELYQKVMKHKISQKIIDKTDSSGEPLGTNVIITISKV